MGNWSYRIVQLKPDNISFFSGIVLSLAVNLLTDLTTNDTTQTTGKTVSVVAAACFGVSGTSLMILWRRLEGPYNKWRKASRESGWNECQIREIAVGSTVYRLWLLVFIASFFFIVGCIILIHQIIF